MDVEVNDETYLPSNNVDNFIVRAFKDMKLSFVVLLICVIVVYIIIFMLTSSNKDNSNPVLGIVATVLEIVLWALLIFIIYINIKNYDEKNFDFRTKMENLFNTKLAEMEVHASSDSEPSETEKETDNSCNSENDSGKEVFHISNNKYSYNEAREICEIYDARLASYDEIENAYNNGANWCSYGWSKDQLALFPTQKKVYNDLKKIRGHENDCGRPGINGGYFKNPNVRFGVNCYGKKPDAKDSDKHYMHSINHTPKLTGENSEELNKLNEYIIAPFNKDKWSII